MNNCLKNYIFGQDLSSIDAPYKGMNYPFGFNGKEKQNELYGEGNGYDFGARIYDPRVGRWMSVDPLYKDFPNQSSYCFSYNTPLLFKDPNGEKGKITIVNNDDGSGGQIIVSTIIYVKGLPLDKADKFIENANNNAKTVFTKGTYKDVNGKVWEISYNIKFVAGEIGNSFEDKHFNNQMYIDAPRFERKASVDGGFAYITSNNVKDVVGNKENGIGDVLEETGHLLGFNDHYDEVYDFVEYKGILPSKGYENDLFTGECREDNYTFISKNNEAMGKYIESLGFLRSDGNKTGAISEQIEDVQRKRQYKNLNNEEKDNLRPSY